MQKTERLEPEDQRLGCDVLSPRDMSEVILIFPPTYWPSEGVTTKTPNPTQAPALFKEP